MSKIKSESNFNPIKYFIIFMMITFFLGIILSFFSINLVHSNRLRDQKMSLKPSIFDFQVENHENKKINLSDFSGKKAYVIVNVASAWGLTKLNYAELQMLYEKYSNSGLEILAFPW